MKPNYLIEGTLNYQTDSTLSDCDSKGFWESGTVVPNCCGPNTGPQEFRTHVWSYFTILM